MVQWLYIYIYIVIYIYHPRKWARRHEFKSWKRLTAFS